MDVSFYLCGLQGGIKSPLDFVVSAQSNEKGTTPISPFVKGDNAGLNLMFMNFNLVGAIHELPLHANKNSCRMPNIFATYADNL